MPNARKPSNRVDRKVRMARKEKFALQHLGALGLVLWGYFGFGIMLLGLSIYSLFQIEKRGIILPVLCFCFALFFTLGKVLFAKRVKLGYSFAKIYISIIYFSGPLGRAFAYAAKDKLKEVKKQYHRECALRKKKIAEDLETSTVPDSDDETPNPYRMPEDETKVS